MKDKRSFLYLAALLASAFGLNLHAASTLQLEYSTYSAVEDEPSVLVAVLRAGDLTGTASVEVVSSDWSATAGEDYEAINLTVEFADGEEAQTFRIPLLNDGIEEATEGFIIFLNNPSGGATLEYPTDANIDVRDNDPGVQFISKHFWGYEVDGQLAVTVERGNDGDLSPFTVDYATSDLTAVAGQDYTAISGTLEFGEGEMTKTLTIPVTEDAEAETREELRITLSNSTGPGGLGANTTADLWLYDTTGHEPRGFSGPQILNADGEMAQFNASLLGSYGGDNALWCELFGIESSEDLETWSPEAWLGIASPELPAAFQQEVDAADRLFYRLKNSALVAAWPPPESSDGAFATREAAVGYTERWVTDPTRRNRYGISDNSAFRVSIWYPALPTVGAVPKRFISVEAAHLWLDSWKYPPDSANPDMVTYSFENAAFRGGETQHPIILYSHAGEPFASGLAETWNRAEYLASQGYVVMAPDHYDCWETRLADGSFYGTPTTPARTADGFQDRVQDFRVLLDLLPEWQESDPILAGRLDLNHLAAMGYQWGAGVAGELCRTMENCRAGVLLVMTDRAWTGADALLAEGTGKPTMFIQWSERFTKDVYSQMEEDAVWLQLADSSWHSLNAWYPWENPLWPERPSNQTAIDHEIAHTLHAYIGSFLSNKVRGNTEDVLWQGPSPEHPRVINYESK